jgi:hypothetical protein
VNTAEIESSNNAMNSSVSSLSDTCTVSSVTAKTVTNHFVEIVCVNVSKLLKKEQWLQE